MSEFLNHLLSPLRVKNLKRQYIALHGLSGLEVEKALVRHLVLLKSKKPGQTEEWYLEKIIYDIQRDRRG